MGRRLAAELLRRGHDVAGLVRRGSESKLPPGCAAVVGDALDATTYADRVSGYDTLVHLVGVAHPGPTKAEQFRTIDLASVDAAVAAAVRGGVRHFVYVSVAHPAPVLRDYVAARQLGEQRIGASGVTATILRPWYVLGPGHIWPIALLPLYGLAGLVPKWRPTAERLGLVTIGTMVRALAACVDSPGDGTRALDVTAIRAAGARS
jgi:uncharacterized protein YbjT (DUF2867 family)